MHCKKYIWPALVIAVLAFGNSGPAFAQTGDSLKVTGSIPKNPLPPPSTSGQIPLSAQPIQPQSSPSLNVPNSSTAPFEHNDSTAALPQIFVNQWNFSSDVPPESLISERYIRSIDQQPRALTLKEAIYIALRNNPNVQVALLNPLAAVETIRVANGNFDPNLQSQIDVFKNVVPTTSTLQTGGSADFVSKQYDWNFGINKVSSVTNGTVGLAFNNNRQASNSLFSGVNPSYNPALTLSLNQPLLQNFGWRFATINVRIAESGQKQQQWTYGQTLQDFVQRVGGEYWGVVLNEELLEVARAALRFNIELVRENTISVKVGTLAPLDLQEAQSAEATAEANVYTAEAQLKNSRAQLRQDVMFNPNGTFIPAEIEPATRPNPTQQVAESEERALELAVQYRPSLAGMREAIRSALLQVKFSENQTLPQLNLGTQFGLTSTAGTTPCIPVFSPSSPHNCTVPGSTPPTAGDKLPFGGIYGDALNRLGTFSFYNYAAVLSFQYPLDNAVARAQLAQARVLYEQQRMSYRGALSQAVADVETAISDIYADVKRAQATAQATYYARQALHDEEVRFRVGMATTHDLLQFQEEEVQAEGNQVQAEVDLENARLALWHAEGTLLMAFQVDFQLQNPNETPWYATF